MAQICSGSGGRRGEFRAWKGYLVRAIGLLLAERTALNLACHLSGVATATALSFFFFFKQKTAYEIHR